MKSIRQKQRQLFEAIVLGSSQPAVSLTKTSRPYLEIHRNNTLTSVEVRLQRIFQVLHVVTSRDAGADSWRASVSTYMKLFSQEDLPQEENLGRHFYCAFDANTPLRELAIYEWLRFDAVEKFSQAPKTILNPSLCLKVFKFNVAEWYKNLSPDFSNPFRLSTKSTDYPIAIYYDGTLVRTRELPPLTFLLLDSLQKGIKMTEIIEGISQQSNVSAVKLRGQLSAFFDELFSEQLLLSVPTEFEDPSDEP